MQWKPRVTAACYECYFISVQTVSSHCYTEQYCSKCFVTRIARRLGLMYANLARTSWSKRIGDVPFGEGCCTLIG